MKNIKPFVIEQIEKYKFNVLDGAGQLLFTEKTFGKAKSRLLEWMKEHKYNYVQRCLKHLFLDLDPRGYWTCRHITCGWHYPTLEKQYADYEEYLEGKKFEADDWFITNIILILLPKNV